MKYFNFFGVPAVTQSDGSVQTGCLWCGHDTNLSVSSDGNHQFQCWTCKKTGNAYTWLREWYEKALTPLTPVTASNLLNRKDGITVRTLMSLGVKYKDAKYYIPVRNKQGSISALHKYCPATNIVYSSPKPTSLTVLGLDTLRKSVDNVVITEGHWDYMTLLSSMPSQSEDYDIIGSCGANYPAAQLSHVSNKHVYLMFDNDDAGTAGATAFARKVKESATPVLSVNVLDWDKITPPEDVEITSAYDIRDLYCDMKGSKCS